MAKPKGTKSTTCTKSTPEKESTADTLNAIEQMLQGQGFVVKNGVFKDTTSLAPGTRATIVSKILVDKRVMFRICVNKLNKVVSNVEMTGDFGLWMTKQGTVHISDTNPNSIVLQRWT
jgi:hypothetical protein